MSKSKNKLSLNALLNDNRFILISSVVIAIIFWLTINIGQNSTVDKTVTDITVNVTTENTSVGALGLDVVSGGTNQKVSVRVSGPSYVVSSLTSADILVTASLSDVTSAGTYELPLLATKNNALLTDYTIVGVVPETLEVTFDNIDTRTFTPVAHAEGAKAVEGLVAEASVLTDTTYSTIDIRGPQSELSKIDTVQAFAAVNKTLSATESFGAVLRLLDADGNELDQSPFTIPKYENLKITVPISRSKELPIVPTFSSSLPGMYTADTVPYTLNVAAVTVIGPPEVVDNLTRIELSPIDFDSVSPDSLSFLCGLNLPNAVKNIDNFSNVEVTLNLGELTTAKLDISSVSAVNLDPGLTATVTQSIKNVVLCGTADAIAEVANREVYAEVDLTGKTVGEYNVLVRVRVRDLNNVWQVGTYSVLVTIS